MRPILTRRTCSAWLLAALLACAPAARACPAADERAPQQVARLSLWGVQTLARTADGAARHLGGISGLDFDPATGLWHLLSDDRGQHAAPRWYPVRMELGAQGLGPAQVRMPVTLPLYPQEAADPEALRRHPCGGTWAWASEGSARLRQPPSVRLIDDAGRPLGALALPEALRHGDRGDTGVRDNRSLEGLAFTPDGQHLWLALEAPLMQDGELPTAERGAWVRFARLPLAGGEAAWFAYPVEALPRAGTGGQKRADNGVSEVLSLRNGDLLVVERHGAETAPGLVFAFGARLYLARPDAIAASPWSGVAAVPLRKRLLLDLGTLGLPHLDNIEAAAWGPRLPDGRATLLLVSDDNFAAHQVTQLIALAVDEAP